MSGDPIIDWPLAQPAAVVHFYCESRRALVYPKLPLNQIILSFWPSVCLLEDALIIQRRDVICLTFLLLSKQMHSGVFAAAAPVENTHQRNTRQIFHPRTESFLLY
jgi:hypothetical protein